MLLQDANDLLFGSYRSHHHPSLPWGGLSSQMGKNPVAGHNPDGMQLICDIWETYNMQHYRTHVLAASLRSASHLDETARAEVDAVTPPAPESCGSTAAANFGLCFA
jgi:Transaldolase/Fructose-6-phosphate aldolase